MTMRAPRRSPLPPDKILNLNVRGMGHSATIAINERSNALRAAGKPVHKLGLGQSPFPVPDQVVESLRRHAHEKDYLPVQGLPALREAVAAYTERAVGVARAGADVLIGPGSKELMFLLQLVYYGDLVVPTPAWVSYAPQARILGRTVQLVPTRREDDWMLTAEGLEAICGVDQDRPRIVVLNYPSNPTGATFTLDELKQIARVARRHRVVLLSDEIYGELHHRGQHVSIARFYPEGTIISSGLSKWCGAGGWRLGTFVFPSGLRWLLDAMASAASETFTSTSAPIQYAAVTAFVGSAEIDDYLARSRRVLSAIGRATHHRLSAADVRCPAPAGGFYLFPDFEAHRDRLAARGLDAAERLAERLLTDTGVAILPGVVFGRPGSELTARLAYVDFDGGAALAAAANGTKLDDAWVTEHAAPTIEAIDLLRRWLERL